MSPPGPLTLFLEAYPPLDFSEREKTPEARSFLHVTNSQLHSCTAEPRMRSNSSGLSWRQNPKTPNCEEASERWPRPSFDTTTWEEATELGMELSREWQQWASWDPSRGFMNNQRCGETLVIYLMQFIDNVISCVFRTSWMWMKCPFILHLSCKMSPLFPVY